MMSGIFMKKFCNNESVCLDIYLSYTTKYNH